MTWFLLIFNRSFACNFLQYFELIFLLFFCVISIGAEIPFYSDQLIKIESFSIWSHFNRTSFCLALFLTGFSLKRVFFLYLNARAHIHAHLQTKETIANSVEIFSFFIKKLRKKFNMTIDDSRIESFFSFTFEQRNGKQHKKRGTKTKKTIRWNYSLKFQKPKHTKLHSIALVDEWRKWTVFYNLVFAV